MAVAYDAYSRSGDGFASSVTWAHTCAGSDRYLLVGIYCDSASDQVTGVTYNGVAMTRIARFASGVSIYLYGLVAPATGANNIIASFTGAIGADVAAMSFTGVDGASAVNDNDGLLNGFQSSPATTPTMTINTGGMAAGFCAAKDDMTNNFAAGTGTTLAGSSQFLNLLGGGYGLNSTALQWTWTGGNQKNLAAAAVTLNPVSVPILAAAHYYQSASLKGQSC